MMLNILSFSQESDNEDLEFKSFLKESLDDTKFAFKLSFLFPSVGAEAKLAEKFSLDFSTRLGINAGATSTGSGSSQQLKFYFFPQPVLHIEPKWNYNIVKRNKLGKKTSKFSSNFLSLHTAYNFKVSAYTFNYLVIGPTWGMQRNFAKYGYFKFKTGLGYRKVFSPINYNYPPLTIILNVQLGLIF